jgi:hypothetical protein
LAKDSRTLYYVGGTVFLRNAQWIVVLAADGFLYYIHPKSRLTEAVEGELLWVIFSLKENERKVESVVPYDQASAADLERDFLCEPKEVKKSSQHS